MLQHILALLLDRRAQKEDADKEKRRQIAQYQRQMLELKEQMKEVRAGNVSTLRVSGLMGVRVEDDEEGSDVGEYEEDGFVVKDEKVGKRWGPEITEIDSE